MSEAIKINSGLAWTIGIALIIAGLLLIPFATSVDGRINTLEDRTAPGVGWTLQNHYEAADKFNAEVIIPLQDSVVYTEKNVLKLMTELGITPVEK